MDYLSLSQVGFSSSENEIKLKQGICIQLLQEFSFKWNGNLTQLFYLTSGVGLMRPHGMGYSEKGAQRLPPKFTFDCISGHFRSIRNVNLFLKNLFW